VAIDKKKAKKAAGRFFGYIGLVSTAFLVTFVPVKGMHVIARILAWCGYYVAIKHRNVAREGLIVAFGKDKTPGERNAIIRHCFDNIAKSGVEMLFLVKRPEAVRVRVRFEGEEHLKAALAKGKGVILVSAHFGNFPLMMCKLVMEGYLTAGIMRPMRDKRVERFFSAGRDRLHLRTILTQPRTVCVSQTIATLRENGIVFIPLDQNFGTGGVFVDFFGKKAATATGPIILAQRTHAALIPGFIVRNNDDTHTIYFEPEYKLVEGATPQESIILNVQNLTTIIESYIRRFPHEWGWIHRRWKSQIPGEDKS
jgi:Kdo2-lipid IVA lauroyltransferase/acyltransferase